MVRGLRCDAAADAGAAGGLCASLPSKETSGDAQRLSHASAQFAGPSTLVDLALLNVAALAVTAALQNAGLKTVDADLSAMPVTVDDWFASPASRLAPA